MAVAEVRQCWGTIGPMEAVGGLPPEFARPGPAARSGFRPARARNDGARDERRSAPIFRDGAKRPEFLQGSPDRCRRASVSGAAQAGSPIASVGSRGPCYASTGGSTLVSRDAPLTKWRTQAL